MNGRGKHKRFRVTATVTFNRAMSMTEARRELRDQFHGQEFFFGPWTGDGTGHLRGPFKATPFPKQVKRK